MAVTHGPTAKRKASGYALSKPWRVVSVAAWFVAYLAWQDPHLETLWRLAIIWAAGIGGIAFIWAENRDRRRKRERRWASGS